jgi:glutathione S-transferase
MGLIFKGLKADVRFMSYSDADHFKPEFIALNPRSTVPILETKDGVLRDSIAILAWLDRAYPAKPLFGSTPAQVGEIWQITMECCDYLREANRKLLTPVFAGDGTIPKQNSTERLALQVAADLAHRECAYLENILSDGRLYLCGKAPRAADAVAYPEIQLLERAVETKSDLLAALGFDRPTKLYPRVSAWMDLLKSDPAVDATTPTHWKATSSPAESAA